MSYLGSAFLLAGVLLGSVTIFYLLPSISRVWFCLKIYRISSRVATEIILAQQDEKPERQNFTVCLKARAYGADRDDFRCDVALGELANALAREFGYRQGIMHYQDEHILFVFYGHTPSQP